MAGRVEVRLCVEAISLRMRFFDFPGARTSRDLAADIQHHCLFYRGLRSLFVRYQPLYLRIVFTVYNEGNNDNLWSGQSSTEKLLIIGHNHNTDAL